MSWFIKSACTIFKIISELGPWILFFFQVRSKSPCVTFWVISLKPLESIVHHTFPFTAHPQDTRDSHTLRARTGSHGFLPHRPTSLPRLDPFFPTKRRRLSARGAQRASRRLSESRPQAATQLQRAAPGLLWLRLGGANITKTAIWCFWAFFWHIWSVKELLGSFYIMWYCWTDEVFDSVWLFCVLQAFAFGLLLRVRPILRTCRCFGEVGATEVIFKVVLEC